MNIYNFVGKQLIRKFELEEKLFDNLRKKNSDFKTKSNEEIACLAEVIPSDKRPNGLRQYNWFCTESEFQILKKEEILNILLAKKHEQYVLNVSSSHKKPTIQSAVINSPESDYVKVTTDNLGVVFISKPLVSERLLPILQSWYSEIPHSKRKTPETFFNKEEIKTGSINLAKIERYGVNKYFAESTILAKYRGSLAFELIVQLLNISPTPVNGDTK